jgi:hypothetical protein
LIFGAGQIVAGGIAARYSLGRGVLAHARFFFLLLVGLWFICSGSLELLVSGLEIAERLGAMLSIHTFNLWRARADTLLLWISLFLLVSLLAYPIIRRLRARP